MALEVATLGGGCFWCTEAVFERLAGVTSVVSGYSGGGAPDPSYREVCEGTTGHAEVVQVEFDPEVIGYAELLEVFFALHDPTTLNRQGNDVGTQYRSVIFYHSGRQMATAHQVIARLDRDGGLALPVVTEVSRFEAFYRAEIDHQEYYRRNASQPYCTVVIDPKIAKLKARFSARLAHRGEAL